LIMNSKDFASTKKNLPMWPTLHGILNNTKPTPTSSANVDEQQLKTPMQPNDQPKKLNNEENPHTNSDAQRDAPSHTAERGVAREGEGIGRVLFLLVGIFCPFPFFFGLLENGSVCCIYLVI
jgi:hypothetical protein